MSVSNGNGTQYHSCDFYLDFINYWTVFSDMLHLSFSCDDKLNLNVNGETIKDFGTFNPTTFGVTAQSDRKTIEY